LPSSLNEIGIESSTLLSGDTAELSDRGFTITYLGEETGLENGNTIEFQLYVDNDQFIWDCTGGSVLNRHRPSRCRGSGTETSYPE